MPIPRWHGNVTHVHAKNRSQMVHTEVKSGSTYVKQSIDYAKFRLRTVDHDPCDPNFILS